MEEVWVSFGLGRALEALRATKPKIMHLELQPRARAFGQSLRRFRQVPPPLEYVQEYLPHQETLNPCRRSLKQTEFTFG